MKNKNIVFRQTNNIPYYSDYPKEPIGGSNPYYKCLACGVSDPQINGQLENHAKDCDWVIQKKIQLWGDENPGSSGNFKKLSKKELIKRADYASKDLLKYVK